MRRALTGLLALISLPLMGIGNYVNAETEAVAAKHSLPLMGIGNLHLPRRGP